MGSSNSKYIDVTNFNPSQWNQIAVHRELSKIVQNINTKALGELQTMPFDPKRDLEKEISIYQYRKQTNNSLVKCLGVAHQKVKNSSICGTSHVLKVLTERVPLRLNQLPQLSFPESLYTLSESLRGYRDCYNKVGPFEVYDEMIGINQQGDVKVWVHENFAQNHPEIQKPLLQTTGGQTPQGNQQLTQIKNPQAEMVESIFKLIERKNEFGKFPQDFAAKIYNRNLTFNEAFKVIELYSKQKNIFVPQRLNNLMVKTSFQQPDVQSTIDRSSANHGMNPGRKLFEEVQTQRVFSPIIYNQPNHSQRRTIQNQKIQFPRQSQMNRATSPVKVSFVKPTSQVHSILSPKGSVLSGSPSTLISPRTQGVGSKITFRLVSPDNSGVTFQRNNSQFINRM